MRGVELPVCPALPLPGLRSGAGDHRQPVILLDGLDELISAANRDEATYLQRVESFQRRELMLGRPVIAIVTSRTGYADRFAHPSDSLVIELAPFTRPQIAEWVEHWNTQNFTYFRRQHLRPLQLDAVLRQRELADQPLLLLLLALYDASANSLLRADQVLSTAELHQGSLEPGLRMRAAPVAARGRCDRPGSLTDTRDKRHALLVQNGDLDYFGGEGLKEIYEFALIELGGQELLDEATDDARRYVDDTHPWSGVAPEPAGRVATYCEVLWERIGRAQETN